MLRLSHLVLLGVIAYTCLAFQSSAGAETKDRTAIAGICDSAAEVAAREFGVPIEVLRAITLTETGRRANGRFEPWPWTVNMEGIGKWFDDVRQAREYVDRHFARGARSFDVGCFQINYKWHGSAFSSIDEMFDPISNARYAARFLSDLYQEFGVWSKAAGAYHSRTPKFAKKYSARFSRILASLPNSEPRVLDVASVPRPNISDARERRENRYPFFLASEQRRGASLVPLARSGTSLLGRETRPAFLDMR